MVDFNNETTIGTPAVDVVRILVLQRQSDLIEAWENYLKKKYSGVQPNTAIVRARLLSMFLQIQQTVKRQLTDEEYIKLVAELKTDDEKIILKNIEILNEILDAVRITRIDTKRRYDKTNVTIEDGIKGL